MAAQFGIKAPEYMGNHCHYIGGWSNVININEVVNTNLGTDSSQASIAGKGISSYSGHTITYDCGAEHQVIMCVYHAVPMLDWNLTGQAPQLTMTAISDFPSHDTYPDGAKFRTYTLTGKLPRSKVFSVTRILAAILAIK